MSLTHDFKETIRARAQRDPDFRQALLREAVECILNGDLDTGKAVLRDYVNATVGFQGLEKRTHIPAKSLMRMLGPKGSPSAANLSSILTALQKNEGVQFELSLRRSSGRAVVERLDPIRKNRNKAQLVQRLLEIGRDCTKRPVLDKRSPEDMLYDRRGLPK